MYLIIITLVFASVRLHNAGAFAPAASIIPHTSKMTTNQYDYMHLNNRRKSLSCHFSASNDGKNEKDSDDEPNVKVIALPLPPSSSSSPEPRLSPTFEEKDEDAIKEDPIPSLTMAPSPSTTVLFVNQQTKRILIEELGYKRSDVDRLRPEFALAIASKRISRPENGIPSKWLMKEEETTSAMLEKLENEQKHPLKIPLLGVSLILFGKGFSDALITLIKVYINFPGADRLVKEQFMGLPVLGIDFVCVVLGAGLGFWTWNNMKGMSKKG